MELRHLRYFVTIAETLSFRKAAEILHISQPPLSMQIKDLEEELGFDLFLRHKKSIEMTEGGKTFLVSAKKILKEAQKAKEDARLAASGKLGKLSIRFNSSAVTGVLQEILYNFKKHFPLVRFDLEQSYVEAIIKDVYEGRADIGLVRTPINLPREMVEIPVLRESYFVALQMSHPLSKKREISPLDLKEEKLIIYPRHTAAGSFDDVLSLFAACNIVPDIVQEAPEQFTIAGLVAAGMGYSVVPECMTKIGVPGIVHRPFKGGKNKTGIAVIVKKTSNPIVKSFLESIKR